MDKDYVYRSRERIDLIIRKASHLLIFRIISYSDCLKFEVRTYVQLRSVKKVKEYIT